MNSLILFIIYALLFVLVAAIFTHDIIEPRYCKPRYRINNEGYVEYYYPPFNRWDVLTEWTDEISKRTAKIIDSGRKIQFDVEYEGPGRYKFYMPEYKDHPKDIKFEQFKCANDIQRNTERIINKESDYLFNNVLKEL